MAMDTGAFAQMRAGLLERLVAAEGLLPRGLRLLLIEGYRPPELQRHCFDTYVGELAGLHQTWTGDELLTAASRYIAPPRIAPHTAGAAVDLTLCTSDGTELDMGTRVNANPEESGGACYTAAVNVAPTAAANRKVLADVLSAAGLVNYPTEWWHWSYGDRYWALLLGAKAARYGPVDGTVDAAQD